MTRNFLIILGLWSLRLSAFTQSITVTGESPNYYLKVDEVFIDGVRITQTLPSQIENFAPGDKVLIIQMTGVSIDSSGNFKTNESRARKSLANTGRFEILQIDEVNTSGSDTVIYFTDNLTNEYDNFEKIQLVRLIEGENVTVTNTLYSKPWDGRVGGIIVILGSDTIKLASNSEIDASGKGFRGAPAPDEIYPDGLCRYGLSDEIADTLFFYPHQLYRSGNKGEGIITTKWPYTKGRGFNFNGGGAGNGLFSGGGGGSNYFAGGDGGQQSGSCAGLYPAKGGWGGYNCYEFYFAPDLPRVIFGGGGGTGNRKSGSTPSNGGNGGGLIILITGTIEAGSDVIVKANGTDAWPSSTTGSGAGGGGGGTVIIDATDFKGSQYRVEIKGGKGSSTTTPLPYVNGAGGGGSGGVFWHSGAEISGITLDSLNGTGGTTPGGSVYPLQLGLPGLQGKKLTDLIVPLTGFLFNSIHGTDTICESQFPHMLRASQPKGGDGSYTHIWQQSTDKVNWNTAVGEDELRIFKPAALNQTTYYRRIVSSRNPVSFEEIHDTSRVVEVFVYPSIGNNNILGIDTICYDNDAKLISGSSATGGNNNYSYIWQYSTDQEQWINTGNFSDYDPPKLTTSTSFRRIVNSTPYCADTSNSVKIAVLPSVTGNSFISDTAICEGTSPGQIKLNIPGGGDGNYSYKWQYRSTAGWNGLLNTADSICFTVGILTSTTYYRRIVYSGFNNACIDTSNIKTISVRPQISNNIIEGSAIKYTCYNAPVSLNGSEPTQGFGAGTYSYIWEESNNNSDWQQTTGENKNFQSGNLISTRYFRRRVFSTPQYRECQNISPSVEVRTNPLPTGNIFSTSDTICAGSSLQVKFNVEGNGPFNVSVKGDIETSKTLTGITGPTDSLEFNPTITQNFVLVSVEDDSGCFADVSGFIPLSPAIVYQIPVANAGADSEACGYTYTLKAVKTNAAYIGSWAVSDAVLSDSAFENAIVTVSNFGQHVFKWTEMNWHCADDDEVAIIFYEQPQLPDAGADQELNFIYTTQLQASAPSVGNGTWSVASGACDFNDVFIPDAIVSELDDMTVLRWTIINGNCPAVSDSVKISVLPPGIKKAFTPNGDGINDYFYLGALNAENINIKIFNRSGQLVFESDDYCGGEFNDTGCKVWDGFGKNNVELPEGTYFYISRMKIAGRAKEIEFKSFVEIIR